jgi:hypothetical protein
VLFCRLRGSRERPVSDGCGRHRTRAVLAHTHTPSGCAATASVSHGRRGTARIRPVNRLERVRRDHRAADQGAGPSLITVEFSAWRVRAMQSLDFASMPVGGIAGKSGTLIISGLGVKPNELATALMRHPGRLRLPNTRRTRRAGEFATTHGSPRRRAGALPTICAIRHGSGMCPIPLLRRAFRQRWRTPDDGEPRRLRPSGTFVR